MNFWQKLNKPFFCLAPLADVTDAAFRRIIAKYGKPDIMWTEFVSADGLVSEKGREHLMIDLAYTEAERPIVAQLFSGHPNKMKEAAALCAKLGFDGIDINMGCPDRSVEKQGAGAALIKDFKLAQEIIRAAQDGAGGLPVSVKTRIGYGKDILEEWLGVLLETKPAAITVHARTRKEMSNVPARWETVSRAVKLAQNSGTLIIGNGDVKDLADARVKAEETGADGIMLGRAIFGNPWLFANLARDGRDCQIEHPASISLQYKGGKVEFFGGGDVSTAQSRDRPNTPSGGECAASKNNREIDAGRTPIIAERLRVMLEHTKLFEKLLGDKKNFATMKKHYRAYANGFDGAKELRVKLMEAEDAGQVEVIVKEFLKG